MLSVRKKKGEKERREKADGLCEKTCGICIACPGPYWNYTGSWGPGLPGEDYTEGWGSPNSTKGFPPSKHPEWYSMTGSTNNGNKGRLTVLSGDLVGWTRITFSGGHVVDVRVTGPTGETLKGQWDAPSQRWKGLQSAVSPIWKSSGTMHAQQRLWRRSSLWGRPTPAAGPWRSVSHRMRPIRRARSFMRPLRRAGGASRPILPNRSTN